MSGGFWGPIGRAFPWVAVGGGGGAVGHVANVSALQAAANELDFVFRALREGAPACL